LHRLLLRVAGFGNKHRGDGFHAQQTLPDNIQHVDHVHVYTVGIEIRNDGLQFRAAIVDRLFETFFREREAVARFHCRHQ
jgi:hypothetical protein